MKNIKAVYIGILNGEWLLTTEKIKGFELATVEDIENILPCASILDCGTSLYNNLFEVVEGIYMNVPIQYHKYDGDLVTVKVA